MAKKSRSTFQKHFKEQARQQKQKDKAARRLEAKNRRANPELGAGETAPDLADIDPDALSIAESRDRASGYE